MRSAGFFGIVSADILPNFFGDWVGNRLWMTRIERFDEIWRRRGQGGASINVRFTELWKRSLPARRIKKEVF
jgi:hypothetical protein